MFERETRREKILEARNKELRLKEKTKGILGLGGGLLGGGGGDGNSNTTASGVPLPPDVKRVEALVKDVDHMLGGEVKKRLPCAGYRILLPNLMGFRPERSTQWILRVSRAILHAKMRDDALAKRNERLRVRFPEFVFWLRLLIHPRIVEGVLGLGEREHRPISMASCLY